MGIREDLEEAKEEIQELKGQSLAMELYQDSAKDKRKFFYMWLITFIAFIGLLGYTIWLLNDIGTIESDTDTIDIQDVETYIKMARAWLDDPDAKEHKLWKYFVG